MSSEIAVACPGDVLGAEGSASCGTGCYARDGKIIASLAGSITYEETDAPSGKMVSVTPWNSHNATASVINVGDEVIGQVTRIGSSQASVDIVAVENKILTQTARGSIRREDTRPDQLDSLVMHTCFRPGDIVRATVISLGDARQYFLSTAAKELGVLRAKNDETGNELVPVSLQEMEDPVTKKRETRKVAAV
jgi:exosome complex component CSL4